MQVVLTPLDATSLGLFDPSAGHLSMLPIPGGNGHGAG